MLRVKSEQLIRRAGCTGSGALGGLDEGLGEGGYLGGDLWAVGIQFDLFHDRGADHDAVGNGGHEGCLFGSGDAESDADGNVGVLFDGRNQLADLVRGGAM